MNTTKWFKLGLLLVLMLIIAASIFAAPIAVPDTLIQAIHKVETGGKFGPILGDKGKALGPLQIHREYWRDSGVAGQYEQCADYDYSVRVVNGYMNKYALRYLRRHDLESLARIHNGGPSGNTRDSTLKYWQKISLCVRDTCADRGS